MVTTRLPPGFSYTDGRLCCEQVFLDDLATQVGTPTFVYSKSALLQRCAEFQSAFASHPTHICFAVKSLSNIGILNVIFNAGLGADLVSGGELTRAISAGVKAETCVFSGVGKTSVEIDQALSQDIMMFNVEADWELDMISSLAKKQGKRGPISLRINPNIDAGTNDKIATGLYSSKFGLAEADLPPLLARIARDPYLQLVGLACHIGSQITDLRPIEQAAREMSRIAVTLRESGFPLRYLDLGGGLGITYRDEAPPDLQRYASTLITAAKTANLTLVIEPGRSLVGQTGILLTRVLGTKSTPQKVFAVVDAAMNDLLRPTLYGAHHEILPVAAPATAETHSLATLAPIDFVGPICETGDFIAKNRLIKTPQSDDLFAVMSCGAYGSSMGSNYNTRPSAPEILIHQTEAYQVRRRQPLQSLWEHEVIPALSQ